MKGKLIGKIILYIFLKYTLLYVPLMVIWNDYAIIKSGTLDDLNGYLIYLCVYNIIPTFSIILLSWLLYFSLRTNSLTALILFTSTYILADYFLFVYLVANGKYHIHGIISVIIGIVLFLLMFFRRIKWLYKGGAID